MYTQQYAQLVESATPHPPRRFSLLVIACTRTEAEKCSELLCNTLQGILFYTSEKEFLNKNSFSLV